MSTKVVLTWDNTVDQKIRDIRKKMENYEEVSPQNRKFSKGYSWVKLAMKEVLNENFFVSDEEFYKVELPKLPKITFPEQILERALYNFRTEHDRDSGIKSEAVFFSEREHGEESIRYVHSCFKLEQIS